MKISQIPTPPRAPHRVAPAVPAVEVADHRDPGGVRRPDREMHAPPRPHARSRARPAAPTGAGACLRGSGSRRGRPGPAGNGRGRGGPRCRRRCGRAGCSRTKPADPRAAPSNRPAAWRDSSSPTTAPVALLDHFEPVGAGHQGPDHHPARRLVRTQHGERVVVARLDQRLNGRVGDAALRGANHTCPPARSTVPLATCECTINPSSPHSRSAKTIILIHGA